jgi:hypothetical protein
MRNIALNETNIVNNIDRLSLCDNILLVKLENLKKSAIIMLTEHKYFGSKIYKTMLKAFFSSFIAVCNVN